MTLGSGEKEGGPPWGGNPCGGPPCRKDVGKSEEEPEPYLLLPLGAVEEGQLTEARAAPREEGVGRGRVLAVGDGEGGDDAEGRAGLAPDLGEMAFNRERLSKAFAELSSEETREVLGDLSEAMRAKGTSRVVVLDAASAVLYMAINLVPDGQKCVEEAFPGACGYRVLYQARSSEDAALWLDELSAGLCRIFDERRLDWRAKTVRKIQAYIDENLTKRLTLADVAGVFGYSQSYISTLFGKYSALGFTDYVNNAKIEKAKKLLANQGSMVYEVASELGFESPFYFSKVFKKVTGVSPTTWQSSFAESGGKGESK